MDRPAQSVRNPPGSMLEVSVPLGHSDSGKTYHVNLIPHSTMSASAFVSLLWYHSEKAVETEE